ncbi:porin family protein [Hymenobacter humi]
MKKALLSLLLLAGLHGAAHAQSGNLSLGLKAGGTLSTFSGADATSMKNLFGFHAGVLANLSLTNHIAFQPELLYSQKGAQAALDGSTDKLTYRLHYVDVPLALHLNVDGLFFEAGPQVGFLAAAQSKLGSASTDVKAAYNTVDVGYLAGLGYQRKTGLGVGLRYNGGVTNVSKETTVGSTTYQIRARNSAFQLYLTYSFNGR